MLNSFKDKVLRTIEQFQYQRDKMVEALQGLTYEQIASELVNYSEAKSVRTLLSVLESDFDMQQDTIESLFEKIEHIRQYLTKQQTASAQDAPRISTLHVQPHYKYSMKGLLHEDDNYFLKQEAPDPRQLSPTIYVTSGAVRTPARPPRRTKLVKQLLHKYKLKTDVEPHTHSYSQHKVMTEASQEMQYYSEQKVPEYRHIDGAYLHYERVFAYYHKLSLGLLKENSFEERSQSYKTMNYEKILAFLTDVGLNLTADGRLTIIKIMRKHALNHKFISKHYFKDIYDELCATFEIREELVHQLLAEKYAIVANARDNTRKRIISVERTLDATKKDPSKSRNRRAVVLSYDREKIERTYTSNAAEKLKIKELTWEVLFNLSDASLFGSGHIPAMDLNRANEEEDSYYLQEYYNKKDNRKGSPIKELYKQSRTKTILPVIRNRLTPLRPH